MPIPGFSTQKKPFLIIGSDSMWSKLTEEEAVDIVRLNGVSVESALDDVHDDNTSVILIGISPIGK